MPTVFITGASRGIGRSCAIDLAKNGCNIVINYKSNETEAKKVQDEIKKYNVKSITYRCDVSKEEEVKKMIDFTVENLRIMRYNATRARVCAHSFPLRNRGAMVARQARKRPCRIVPSVHSNTAFQGLSTQKTHICEIRKEERPHVTANPASTRGPDPERAGEKAECGSRCRQQLGAGREQAPAEIPPAPCPGAGRFRGRVKEGVGMKKNLRAGRSGLPERGPGRS